MSLRMTKGGQYDNVSCTRTVSYTRTVHQQLESRETDLHWDSRMHEHLGSGKGVATPATCPVYLLCT